MRRIFLWGSVVLVMMGNLVGCAPVPLDNVKQGESHYILGISFLREGNPTMALKEFLEAESYDPRNPDLQNALGQAYQLKKSYAHAEQHYLKALELKPEDPNILNNLGALYLDMKEWDKAIASFQKAAGNLLFNNPEIALTGMGIAWYYKGDPEKALTLYRKALDQKRSFAPAYYRSGEVYRELKDYSRARENYQRALELAPNSALAYYGLGLVCIKEQKYAEARVALNKVVALAGDSEVGDEARQLLKTLP
jgi:Tfp pilus assembly protein PilF